MIAYSFFKEANVMEKQQANPLGYEPIGKLLRAFALPAVISMLINAIYNIVDQIFIGQGVGYLGNAATTIAFPIVTIILAVGTTIGAGGSAYAAIKLGEKRNEEAELTLGNAFLLLSIIGIIMTVIGLLAIDPLLHLFGATAKTWDYAKTYTAVLIVGTTFNLLGIGLSNLVRTDGNPKLAMYAMLVGAILNTFLDPLYIFVFHWGVFGAALATITSQIISTVILTYYFIKKGQMRLRKETLRLDPFICKRILGLGFSSGVTQMAGTILQITMNNMLITQGNASIYGGDIALSAMGIVTKISMILTSICIGISIGSQPIIGFNRGAKAFHRVKRTSMMSIGIAGTVSTLGWALCLLFPNQILSIFGDSEPLFTEFAVLSMRIFLMGIFTAGFQIAATGYFQASGQPLKATILSMMRQVILLIPLIIILGNTLGLNGILYAGPIADIGAGIVVALFVTAEFKKLNRLITTEEQA